MRLLRIWPRRENQAVMTLRIWPTWHGMAWYGMVWYGMVWYGMVDLWCGMDWYGMVSLSDYQPRY